MATFGTGVLVDETKPRSIVSLKAAVVITAGQICYRDGNGKWALAQSNGTATLPAAGFNNADVGVAVTSVEVADQYVDVLTRGYLTGCSGLLAGEAYVVSDSAAGDQIAHSALTEDTDYACLIGMATTTTTLTVNPLNTNAILNLLP